jgi:hypothetical protein
MYWAVDNLVQALEGRMRLLASGRDYLEAEKVLEAIARSAKAGGRPVKVN